MGNSTRRRSDAHSGAARSTAASRPHCADHWRELSAERQAQSGINQGCEESVIGPGVGQFYFGVFGPGWVKIQSALTVPGGEPRTSDGNRPFGTNPYADIRRAAFLSIAGRRP